MAKKVARRGATKTTGPDWNKKVAAAKKKDRVGTQEYDEGTYVFQLMDVTYGTRKDPNKPVFFTKTKFVTGAEGTKGRLLSVGWNCDDRQITDEITNTDLFIWFVQDLGVMPPEFNPDSLQKKVKRVTPHFRAQLTKSKGDSGGIFYNLKYAEKLNKDEVAAL